MAGPQIILTMVKFVPTATLATIGARLLRPMK
jgi:hypothetical protein